MNLSGMIETMWPVEAETFTVWPFTEAWFESGSGEISGKES